MSRSLALKRLPTRTGVILFYVCLVASCVCAAYRLAPASVESAAAPREVSFEAIGVGAAAVRSALQTGRPEVEIVTLTDSGFDPAQITRHAGRILLAVNNKTSLDQLVLRLGQKGGRPLHEARLVRGGRNWRQTVDLAPGTYVLGEAGHPDWVCRITVTD
jgi:hypothetical protein